MHHWKTNVALEDLEVKLYNIFETDVHTNPLPFTTSLSLLQKMLSDSQEKPSDLRQMHVWKSVLKVCIIFL